MIMINVLKIVSHSRSVKTQNGNVAALLTIITFQPLNDVVRTCSLMLLSFFLTWCIGVSLHASSLSRVNICFTAPGCKPHTTRNIMTCHHHCVSFTTLAESLLDGARAQSLLKIDPLIACSICAAQLFRMRLFEAIVTGCC